MPVPIPVRVREQRTSGCVWGMLVGVMRLTELEGEYPHVIRERTGLAQVGIQVHASDGRGGRQLMRLIIVHVMGKANYLFPDLEDAGIDADDRASTYFALIAELLLHRGHP